MDAASRIFLRDKRLGSSRSCIPVRCRTSAPSLGHTGRCAQPQLGNRSTKSSWGIDLASVGCIPRLITHSLDVSWMGPKNASRAAAASLDVAWAVALSLVAIFEL